MPEEENTTSYKNIVIFLVCSVIFYLIMKDKGYISIKHGLFWPLAVGALLVSTETIKWWSRYRMPHLVLNGFSGSIWGRPDIVNDENGMKWAIFNTGEFKEPVHGRGKLATVIIPFNQLKCDGMNYHGSTLVKKTPFKILPSILFNYLRYNKERFNVEKIYYGYVDEDFVHQNPDFADLEAEIEALNTRINSQRLTIEGNNDELIEHMELMKKLNQPSLIDRLRRNPQADVGVRE